MPLVLEDTLKTDATSRAAQAASVREAAVRPPSAPNDEEVLDLILSELPQIGRRRSRG